MITRIRVLLETEHDVFRDIEIDENDSLEKLHYAIISAFDFDGFQMASFFLTNENWETGQEIPLLDISEQQKDDCILMNQMLVSSAIKDENSKLIYVYDFMNMWRFYINFVSSSKESESKELPACILKIGELPEEAPEINFESEAMDDFDPFDSAFDDFDEFSQYE